MELIDLPGFEGRVTDFAPREFCVPRAPPRRSSERSGDPHRGRPPSPAPRSAIALRFARSHRARARHAALARSSSINFVCLQQYCNFRRAIGRTASTPVAGWRARPMSRHVRGSSLWRVLHRAPGYDEPNKENWARIISGRFVSTYMHVSAPPAYACTRARTQTALRVPIPSVTSIQPPPSDAHSTGHGPPGH